MKGVADEKSALGQRPRETSANHSALGLQRLPTIHPQSTHKLSTGACIAKTTRPHYLVSQKRKTPISWGL